MTAFFVSILSRGKDFMLRYSNASFPQAVLNRRIIFTISSAFPYSSLSARSLMHRHASTNNSFTDSENSTLQHTSCLLVQQSAFSNFEVRSRSVLSSMQTFVSCVVWKLASRLFRALPSSLELSSRNCFDEFASRLEREGQLPIMGRYKFVFGDQSALKIQGKWR